MYSYNKIVKKERIILDFKNFCDYTGANEQSNRFKNENLRQSKNQASSNKETEKLEKDAQKIFEQYSNFSNEQLMQELIEKTNEKMKDGSLDKQKMEQIYNSIYNFLPPENRQSLKDIFSRLKW